MRAKLANLKADGHDAFAFVAWIDCILALIHPFTDESPGFSTAAEAGLPCVGAEMDSNFGPLYGVDRELDAGVAWVLETLTGQGGDVGAR
ncbi:hypothetical protein C8T65DRAFT_745213 [Cerioporus squamosus]|nr:hypothetical protein C8T65DRAFT_745213 [Cerioporus squamosus]